MKSDVFRDRTLSKRMKSLKSFGCSTVLNLMTEVTLNHGLEGKLHKPRAHFQCLIEAREVQAYLLTLKIAAPIDYLWTRLTREYSGGLCNCGQSYWQGLEKSNPRT